MCRPESAAWVLTRADGAVVFRLLYRLLANLARLGHTIVKTTVWQILTDTRHRRHRCTTRPRPRPRPSPCSAPADATGSSTNTQTPPEQPRPTLWAARPRSESLSSSAAARGCRRQTGQTSSGNPVGIFAGAALVGLVRNCVLPGQRVVVEWPRNAFRRFAGRDWTIRGTRVSQICRSGPLC